MRHLITTAAAIAMLGLSSPVMAWYSGNPGAAAGGHGVSQAARDRAAQQNADQHREWITPYGGFDPNFRGNPLGRGGKSLPDQQNWGGSSGCGGNGNGNNC
jgi:hypothetical protein